MKETSTVRVNGNMIFKGHKLTIGVDLGDRWSYYCVLDEAGEILLEQKLATTPEGMKQTFERIPRSLMAMETGTHSPWVSRLLKELGHEVLVAHAQRVELISKSTRKDDRHDARTLARLARIDPELLGPVRHRSAKAQIHLTVIRARAALVSFSRATRRDSHSMARNILPIRRCLQPNHYPQTSRGELSCLGPQLVSRYTRSVQRGSTKS